MKFLILFSLFILASCGKPYHKDKTELFSMPEDLKDCKVYYISTGSSGMNVVRCPNSETTTKHSCGKNCTRNTTLISE